MFGLLKNFQGNQLLMKFYGELKKNLELYHVHDQRQFIDKEFRAEIWEQARSLDVLKSSDKILDYGRAIEDFNQFFRAFRDFEKWYAGDMTNKTKENAQKLHTQRSELDAKLKNLYPVICLAGEELEYKLISLGLIKE